MRKNNSYRFGLFFVVVFNVYGCVVGDNKPRAASSLDTAKNVLVEYPDGRKYVEKFLVKEPAFFKVICYYDNDRGSVSDIRYENNGKICGERTQFFENGIIKEKGQYKEGKKIGDFKYYDVHGKLICIRKYIEFSGNENGYYMNEIINFDKGDTVLAGSVYFDLSAPDTIGFGDDYTLRVEMKSGIFEKAGFVICDYDSTYKLIGSNMCDTTYMNGFVGDCKIIEYKEGWNTVRGMIYNYDVVIKSDGSREARGHEMYFSKAFYVRN